MTQIIRLGQEGVIRPEGFQLSQWTSKNYTTSSLQELFLIRSTVVGEKFERITTLPDFQTYEGNELQYFEPKKTGGEVLFDAVTGDEVALDPIPSYWVQTTVPYNPPRFYIGHIVYETGSAPEAIAPEQMRFPGVTLTDEYIGRWVQVNGFAHTSYNSRWEILSYSGNIAQVRRMGSTGGIITEGEISTGTFYFGRWQIIALPAGIYEFIFFPTKISDAPWKLYSSTHVLKGWGNYGETQRRDKTLQLFRSMRMTTIEPTLDAALNRMSVVRKAVEALSYAANQNSTDFSTVLIQDYPPT